MRKRGINKRLLSKIRIWDSRQKAICEQPKFTRSHENFEQIFSEPTWRGKGFERSLLYINVYIITYWLKLFTLKFIKIHS